MLRKSTFLTIVMTVSTLAWSLSAPAQGTRGARIDNLKVLSDKIDDVTTTDNILKSFIKPGMTDAERAKALWQAAVKYRHQSPPPTEDLADDWEAHDPAKIFNVYGYCMCCCASSLIESLNRLDGREARGRILNGHSVPEVKYGGAWHMYDCSLINYFPKPDTGDVASVDEITAAVQEWGMKHPDARRNDAKLGDIMRSDGWTGWKSQGPVLLANNPFYRMGFWPAGTHGWNSTMQEYDRQCEVYEYGYQVGYRALFSLRPGESLERDAGNRGLHVNMDKDPDFGYLKFNTPQADVKYVTQFIPGYNGGVVGNGYHRYAPDLTAGNLAAGAEVYQNLAEGAGAPALGAKQAGKPGVAVVEISCPYVYLGGRLKLSAVKKSSADRVRVSLSTNNGRTFTPVWSADAIGTSSATIDLKDRIFRRYAYWLKIEIESASPHGAGLNTFAVENDIQHAPRTLPWLGKGSNTITVAGDGDTHLACRTISCRITPDTAFNKNESSGSMGVTFDNLNVHDSSCWWKGGEGAMTVPIETPGDMAVLRYGAQIRARDAKDVIKMALSFDEGKTWQETAHIAGPTQGTTQYFRFTDFPAHTRKALLRYVMTGVNTVGVLSFRVDADYKDPLASPTFHPFTVVHRWKESGQEKSKQVVVTKLPFTYKIDTQADPEMVSVSYAMPTK